jgi:choline dehydrogenase-like flavoprotein
MGLQPHPTPKMVRLDRCIGCGKCMLGCARGAKWDSRAFLDQAIEKGAELVSGCAVKKIVVGDRRAIGVVAGDAWSTRFYPADLVVLAAGGLGTPLVLEQSGIVCRPDLFVDPVLCVAARWEGALQNREMPMPFIVQSDRYMVSPYFDFLSFFFNRRWKSPARDIFSLMIKLADDSSGTVHRRKTEKLLTDSDRSNLKEAVGLCTEIFRKLGKRPEELVLGTVNAGHPGGMLPLTEKERSTLHPDVLPNNVYVADGSLLPKSLGNPPILTIAALAKRIGKLCS